MASWLGQSIRRGIVTTAYPAAPSSSEETPDSARPPRPAPDAPIGPEAVASCPVEALAPGRVDDGKCIRCARCLAHGLAFVGPVESSAASRDALRHPGPTAAPAPAPLAPLGRSLHVFLVDVGSCTACNLEVLAIANPYYDAARLGIFFTNSPRHADVLLVVGVPTRAMEAPLRRAYEAIPAPKAVVAVGVCPISGGLFAGSDAVVGPLDGILPVDIYVPGCPPTPLNVLDGLLRLQGRSRAERGA